MVLKIICFYCRGFILLFNKIFPTWMSCWIHENEPKKQNKTNKAISTIVIALNIATCKKFITGAGGTF